MTTNSTERRFRYDTGGRWFKGNTHLHTANSDGGKTCAEAAEMYASAGYDFLCATDHWVASDVNETCPRDDILWLDGIELDGHDETGALYHVVGLGRVTGITRQMGFAAALAALRRQGALTILAHPHWTGNSFDDALRWAFDGVEVYNHVCRWLNGKGDGAVYWSAMLQRNPATLAFAADDAHLRPEHPGWDGGWIVVNAAERTPEQIMESIRQGRYYASCGPRFLAISYDGSHVEIETSPVQFIRLTGPAHRGQRVGSFDARRLTHARFAIPADWSYAYLELEDELGRRAWSNTLFVAIGA
jgi:hypothetical protein